MVSDRPGRRWLFVVALTVIVTLVAQAQPAAASPGDEGGTPELQKTLEAANKAYLEAEATLNNSRKRQAELVQKLADIEKRIAGLGETGNQLAALAYRNNRLRNASALLSSGSPDEFMDRATTVGTMAMHTNRKLREYGRLQREYTESKKAIDAEVATQEQQLAEMDKRRKEAERALIAAGGGQKTNGYSSPNTKPAQPAPRQANGQLPPQGCTISDPTGTGGCVTARMLNAYNQARAAGFTHYTSCWRSGGGGEHPKGRACDFAAAPNTFGGVASGADRTYGNNLAAYFVNNAGALGVLYVIWFIQIWQPSTGWRSYSGRCGQPSCDHTNHVHLSVV
jgi:peptidoglycan DL-endopeptidase CwlO